MSENMQGNGLHSVWLCPEPSLETDLQNEIDALTAITGTASFAPHVTFLGDIAGSVSRTQSVCAKVFGRLPALEARVRDVASTERYFMSLFLDIDLPNDIRLARSHAAAALELPDTPFRPHISLAYGFTNGGASVDLLGELRSKYVDRRLVLSAFACVNSSSQTDIKDWKIYFKHSFAGRS